MWKNFLASVIDDPPTSDSDCRPEVTPNDVYTPTVEVSDSLTPVIDGNISKPTDESSITKSTIQQPPELTTDESITRTHEQSRDQSLSPHQNRRQWHGHGHSKAHQRQLVKELATKLHHLEAIVQVELPALQQQLSEQEMESAATNQQLTTSHAEQTRSLKQQITQVKETNKTLTQSLLKTKLRNTHISQEYETLLNTQVCNEREIKILKESIVDLRTVMTRLPSAPNAPDSRRVSPSTSTTTSPEDSLNNRTAFRILKRKMGRMEVTMVKTPLTASVSENKNTVTPPPEKGEGGRTHLHMHHAGVVGQTHSSGTISQQLLKDAETQIDSLKCQLVKQLDEIACLKKQASGCAACSSAKSQPTHEQRDRNCNSNINSINNPNQKSKNYSHAHVSAPGSPPSSKLVLSPSRAGRIPAATNHNNTEAVTSNTLALKKKDQQIEMYRQKLAESYEEREQEQLESKVTLRYLTKKLDTLNLILGNQGGQIDQPSALYSQIIELHCAELNFCEQESCLLKDYLQKYRAAVCRMRGSAVPGIVPLQEEDKRAAVTLVYISIVVVAGQSRLNKIPCLVFLSAELHGASTTAYRA